MSNLICSIASLILFCVVTLSLSAQEGPTDDSTNTSSKPSLADLLGLQEVRISGAHYFSPVFSDDLHALEPEYLGYLREEREFWNTSYYSILDNPLFHGATFLDLEATFRPHPGLFLVAGITAENRGISYGVGNTDNSVLQLRYLFGIDTSFVVGEERFGVAMSVGDRRNTRVDEGLFFQNADVQGAKVLFDWKSLFFDFTAVGDAFAGVGLRIDDAYFFRLGLKDIGLLNEWKGTLTAGAFYFSGNNDVAGEYFPNSPRQLLAEEAMLSDYGYTASGSVYTGDTAIRLYGQAALRQAGRSDYLMNRMAVIAGGSFQEQSEAWQISITGEYRYYGGLFNAGFRNTDVFYRDTGRSAWWKNTIGPHLYRLEWLERPFRQWAVFAEYQDLKDVTGWTLYAKGKWFFYDRFLLRGLLDLNYIVAENLDPYLYPFYDVGLGWEPFDQFSVVVSATNKGMNLDKHYPTFYLFERPAPMVSFRWNRE